MRPEHRALRTWFQLFCVLGALPFKWQQNEFIRRVGGTFLSSAIGFTHTIMFWNAFWELPAMLYLHCLLYLYCLLLPLFHPLILLLNRQKLSKAVQSLIYIHEDLTGRPIHIPTPIIIGWVATTLLVIVEMIYVWFIHNDNVLILYAFGWRSLTIYENNVLFVYVTYVGFLRYCLFKMNESLICNNSSSMENRLIDAVVPTFNELADSFRSWNDCFGVQMFFILTMKVLRATFEIQLWYSGYAPTAEGGVNRDSTCISFSLITLVCVTILFSECEKCKHEENCFTNLLSNLALQNCRGKFKRNCRITMHFIVRNKLNFKTYGGLKLNYRLMLSLIATCVTGLMLLQQFNRTASCAWNLGTQQ